MKAILISTDRTNLEITTQEFDTVEDAHNQMLTEILDQSDYESVDDLVNTANNGEAGYSDRDAWISHSECDTIVWSIITVEP
jgi:hypothetical protein